MLVVSTLLSQECRYNKRIRKKARDDSWHAVDSQHYSTLIGPLRCVSVHLLQFGPLNICTFLENFARFGKCFSSYWDMLQT